MQCPYCDHPKAHKHDRTSKGHQRFKCPQCGKTFTETLNTIDYRRQVTAEEVKTILQIQAEGTSLRGISRVSHRAYGTVVSLLRAASEKSQLVPGQSHLYLDKKRRYREVIATYLSKSMKLQP